MKHLPAIFLFSAMLIALVACPASAQLPDTLRLEFDFEGIGNLVTMSPPVYAGDVTSGDPLVAGGTWWVQIDDAGWPGTADPAARWEYIFTTFFVYEGSPSNHWKATFNDVTLPGKPVWQIDAPSGMLGGTLVVEITIPDWDVDGVLDIDERMFSFFNGTMMVMKYGTGDFTMYCGSGSYNGTASNADPANFADDFVSGHCLMDLVNCVIGVEPSSWSALKTRMR